jgi:hypothetical protein
VFREGLAPQLTDADLHLLRGALAQDDPALIQGSASIPPPLECLADWDIEGADLLGWVGWRSRGLRTVGEVEEFAWQTCLAIDSRLGEPGGVKHLLRWYDWTARAEVRRELLAEVDRELALRLVRDAGTRNHTDRVTFFAGRCRRREKRRPAGYFDQPTNDLSSAQANFHGRYPAGNAPKGRWLGPNTSGQGTVNVPGPDLKHFRPETHGPDYP